MVKYLGSSGKLCGESVILEGNWSASQNLFYFPSEMLNVKTIQLEGFKLLAKRLRIKMLPALIVRNVMFEPAFLSCILLAVQTKQVV